MSVPRSRSCWSRRDRFGRSGSIDRNSSNWPIDKERVREAALPDVMNGTNAGFV